MGSLKEKTAQGLFWGGLSNGIQQLLNMAFGIVFPLGILVWLRIWRYRLRLRLDLQNIERINKLIHEIDRCIKLLEK